MADPRQGPLRPIRGDVTSPNEYLWRLPQWAENKFVRLMDELQPLAADEDQAYALRDEIRSLPGFPPNSESYSLIRREITTIH